MTSPRPLHAKLLLTVDEAAALLGIKRTLTYELIRTGALASVRVGRLRRIRYSDLDAYAAGLLPTSAQHEHNDSSLKGGRPWAGSPTEHRASTKARTAIGTAGSPSASETTANQIVGTSWPRQRQLSRRRSGSLNATATAAWLCPVGERWTVASWLTPWVDNIAAPVVRETAIAGYRVAVRRHLIPGVGAHKLGSLEPEHLERLYARMIKAGSAPGTAHQAHLTIRTALNEAVRRGHLVRNPAAHAEPLRLAEHEIEPYTVAEVRRLLDAAGKRRNSARWAVAFALGLRQGEALGLKWSDIDLDESRLVVRRARQRPRWGHGCGGTCGRAVGGYCPLRVPLRSETADSKSRAGRRAIGLPDGLVALLRKHREVQDAERELAAQLWREGGWVFASATGAPLNPNTDYAAVEWAYDSGRPTGRAAS